MANGFQTYHDRSAEFAAQQGYTLMEDGRYMAPDGESFVGAEEMAKMAESLGNDADPLIDGVQYRNIEGWANNDPDPQKALQIELAHLKSFGIEAVQHPEYGWIVPDDSRLAQAHPTQDSSSIFDFGPLLIAAFMVPAIASSLAATSAAGAVAGGVDAGLAAATSEFGGSLVTGATEAGTIANAAVAGGTTAGGGILGNVGAGALRGAITSAATGGDPVRGALTGGVTGGLSDVWSTVTDTVNEWMAPNVFDDLAFDPMAGQVGGDGIGATVDSVATRVGDVASSVKDVLPSNTQDAARKLVQSAEDVTSAEAGSGAWKAVSGADQGGSLLDKIWKGLTSPQGTAAAITTIGGIASGIGAAALNRDTMEKKSELDLANAEALQKFKTDQSRENRFRGIIGVRPAATRAPLQRLTGGPVYNERGLIRRA